MIKIKTRLKYKMCAAITYIIYIGCAILPLFIYGMPATEKPVVVILFLLITLLRLISDIISLVIKKPIDVKNKYLVLSLFVTFVSFLVSKANSIIMWYYCGAFIWNIVALFIAANDPEVAESRNRDTEEFIHANQQQETEEDDEYESGDIRFGYEGPTIRQHLNRDAEDFIHEANRRLGNNQEHKCAKGMFDYKEELTIKDIENMKPGEYIEISRTTVDSKFMFIKLGEAINNKSFCEITSGSIYDIYYILNTMLRKDSNEKYLKIDIFSMKNNIENLYTHEDGKTYKFSKPFNITKEIEEPEEENIFDELT